MRGVAALGKTFDARHTGAARRFIGAALLGACPGEVERLVKVSAPSDARRPRQRGRRSPREGTSPRGSLRGAHAPRRRARPRGAARLSRHRAHGPLGGEPPRRDGPRIHAGLRHRQGAPERLRGPADPAHEGGAGDAPHLALRRDAGGPPGGARGRQRGDADGPPAPKPIIAPSACPRAAIGQGAHPSRPGAAGLLRLLRDPRRRSAEELAVRASLHARDLPRGPRRARPGGGRDPINQELERLLLHRPEQIFWLHDRFKGAPEPGADGRWRGPRRGPGRAPRPCRDGEGGADPATFCRRRGLHPVAGAPQPHDCRSPPVPAHADVGSIRSTRGRAS